MDFFQSHKLCPPLLSYLLPYSQRSILVKRLAGSPKKLKLIPTCANKSVTPVHTHSYIHGWTSFNRTKLCKAVAILPSSIFPNVQLTSKTTGWFTKGLKLIPTCPTLTKCYSKVAHAFLYTWMDFFQSHQTVPKPLLSYLLPYSRTFNCTSKTTGWFTKGLKLIPTCPITKVLLQGSSYTLMDFFQSHQTVPKPLLSSSLIPERSIASKTTGWFTKGLKLIPTCLTKCYSR
jgi:hypothetical protein